MQEVFEKILELLKTRCNVCADRKTELWDIPLSMAYTLYDIEDEKEETLQAIIKDIEQIAKEYNGGWIPCSERLPEEYGEYLVAWKPLYMTKDQMIESVGKVVPHFYEIVEYDPDDDKKWIGDIQQSQGEYEIIAWQPLPKLYKPKGEQCNSEGIKEWLESRCDVE